MWRSIELLLYFNSGLVCGAGNMGAGEQRNCSLSLSLSLFVHDSGLDISGYSIDNFNPSSNLPNRKEHNRDLGGDLCSRKQAQPTRIIALGSVLPLSWTLNHELALRSREDAITALSFFICFLIPTSMTAHIPYVFLGHPSIPVIPSLPGPLLLSSSRNGTSSIFSHSLSTHKP